LDQYKGDGNRRSRLRTGEYKMMESGEEEGKGKPKDMEKESGSITVKAVLWIAYSYQQDW
jgi:hypothetical protein